MTPLPPHLQRRVDELVACAPPLSPAQQRLIRRVLAPPHAKEAQAAPHAA